MCLATSWRRAAAVAAAAASVQAATALLVQLEDEEDAALLHHPGHAAIYVTRMGRFQHFGVEAFLEEEQSWQQGQEPASSSSEPRQYRVVPAGHVAALLEHHEASLASSSSFTEAAAAAAAAAAESKKRQEEAHAVEELNEFFKQAQAQKASEYLRAQQQPQQPRPKTGVVPIALEFARAMYIGPIGVGSIIPAGCNAAQSPAGSSSLMQLGQQMSDGAESAACMSREQTGLNVVFDTGSTNIWISSDMCHAGGCVLPGRRRFNHTDSKTFEKEEDRYLNVHFGTGTLGGPLGTDYLHIGPVQVRQTFAMIESQVGPIWDSVPIEGIVGLGFPHMATADAPHPFFDSVIQQKVLDHNEFAFYLDRDSAATNALLWGGVDPAFYEGKIEYFPVIDPHYWALELTQFSVGNRTLLDGSTPRMEREDFMLYGGPPPPEVAAKRRAAYTAIMDSGTSCMGAPSEIFSDLIELLPKADCESMTEETHPPMVFTLRNTQGQLRQFVLPKESYMVSSDSTSCSPGIIMLDIPPEHGPGMVMGGPFLQKYFSVYDRQDGDEKNARVGLAEAADSARAAKRLWELSKSQKSIVRSPPPEKSAASVVSSLGKAISDLF
eukprot:TRINITY_DN10485_c1_g2_i1.p1 TRINITY_DN10485_c1_g2~~TRINITY_DN10485_c1_g2_i1.p1  ORF type:complete len:608 (+),score=167.45 TRINITY_DN10485_c1_g2_i1:80-1903(+)